MEAAVAAIDLTEKVEKPSVIELRNGKVSCKQKPYSYDKLSETMQEIVNFRQTIEQHVVNCSSPLLEFPDRHKPLIVKLAQESDKTSAALAKHMRTQLLPAQDEDDINSNSSAISAALTQATVEAAIKSVMNRNNYGIDMTSTGQKLPTGLCVWRWEVKEEFRDWLPKSVRERADARLAERIQAKKDLSVIFEALSIDERNLIIDPKGSAKLPVKDTNATSAAAASPAKLDGLDAKETPQQQRKQSKKRAEDAENDVSESTPSKQGAGRPKKDVDPEKAAKEREKLEKKAAKAEREKKEKEVFNKSRSLMANFFSKPKGETARSSPAHDAQAATASSSQSEFERTFKQFVVKKDAEVAPQNWFLQTRTQKSRQHNHQTSQDVIVIDGDDKAMNNDIDVEMAEVQGIMPDVYKMNAVEHLESILYSLPSTVGGSRSLGWKRRIISPRYITRTIINQLSEAEIADNPNRVRSLLSLLRDRDELPVKVLIFKEDARPGYFGTWTRHSDAIGPRTPFARDPVALDYAYDSGEEWEDEGNGDADDVLEGAEDEDADGATDVDSDADSWLVDDEDVGEIGTPLDERDADQLPATLNFPVKRKAEDGERKIGKKRKVVVPLQPFVKGPCWESEIGQCSYEPFDSYRIQLFNDSPYPIDPFTFVSQALERTAKAVRDSSAHAPTFVVPSLPERLVVTSSTLSSAIPSVLGSKAKRIASTSSPKTAFPDVHLDLLQSKVNSLATGSLNLLVDAIHQELKEYQIKKNAIEAKLKEVGEKCKEKRVWVLKPRNSTAP